MSSSFVEYTLPESTTMLGDVTHGVIPDSSQTLPPLMHMGYASAGRHPGKNLIFITYTSTYHHMQIQNERVIMN